jgi:hypothetical protein
MMPRKLSAPSNVLRMSITALVSHRDKSPPTNDLALKNMPAMLRTFATDQADKSPLNNDANLNFFHCEQNEENLVSSQF